MSKERTLKSHLPCIITEHDYPSNQPMVIIKFAHQPGYVKDFAGEPKKFIGQFQKGLPERSILIEALNSITRVNYYIEGTAKYYFFYAESDAKLNAFLRKIQPYIDHEH